MLKLKMGEKSSGNFRIEQLYFFVAAAKTKPF
jgi:hypothetical protein